MDEDNKGYNKNPPGPDYFDQARSKLDDLRKRIPNIDNVPKEKRDLVLKIHDLIAGQALTRSDLNIAESEGNIGELNKINSLKIPQLEKLLNEVQQEHLSNTPQKLGFIQNQTQEPAAIRYYSDPHKDPQIRETEKDIIRKTNQDPDVRAAANQGPDSYKNAWEKANLKIKTKEWYYFTKLYPEKAELYRKIYSPIGDFLETKNKAVKKWEAKSGTTKVITLEQDPIYKNFIDNPDTGLATRLWKEFPNKESIDHMDFRQKTEKIKAELDKEFRLKYPEIAVKYKLLAEKQANQTQEEKKKRQEAEEMFKEYLKDELEGNQEEAAEGETIEEIKEAQAETEVPEQEVVEKVEVRESPQPTQPSVRQAEPPQTRTGAVNRVNRTINNVRGARSGIKRGSTIGKKLLGTGAKRAGVVAGTEVIITSGTWIPILLFLLFLFVVGSIVLMIILIISGGSIIPSGLTPSGTPTPSVSVTPPPGGACPDQATIDANKSPTACRYLDTSGIGLFDTIITQTGIDAYISIYSGIYTTPGIMIHTPTGLITGTRQMFIDRTNYIVQQSIARGINPAIPLGYWRTEANFSTGGNYDLGCAINQPPVTFEEQVDCLLAQNAYSNPTNNSITNCARSGDANSTACTALRQLRTQLTYPPPPLTATQSYDQLMPIHYPIGIPISAGFNDFAEAYGPWFAPPTGLTMPPASENCSHTYNELVEVAKLVGMCKGIPPPGNIRQEIQNRFGLIFVDGTSTSWDYTHLTWAWQKLNEVSSTRFISLVTNTTVTAIPLGSISNQSACRNINLSVYTSEEFFKLVLTHELSHIIRNCDPASSSYFQAHFGVFQREGGVTYYANNAYACTGSDNASEDYAEMIAYFLNLSSPSHTASCVPAGEPNPYNNCPGAACGFPLHYDLARIILGV